MDRYASPKVRTGDSGALHSFRIGGSGKVLSRAEWPRGAPTTSLALYLGARASLLPASAGQFGKAVLEVSATQLGFYDALARNENDPNTYNAFVGPALAGGPRPVPLAAAHDLS